MLLANGNDRSSVSGSSLSYTVVLPANEAAPPAAALLDAAVAAFAASRAGAGGGLGGMRGACLLAGACATRAPLSLFGGGCSSTEVDARLASTD